MTAAPVPVLRCSAVVLKGAATRRRKTTTRGETEGRGNKAAVDGAAREGVRREQQVDAMAD
jgi:hypothetical protein